MYDVVVIIEIAFFFVVIVREKREEYFPRFGEFQSREAARLPASVRTRRSHLLRARHRQSSNEGLSNACVFCFDLHNRCIERKQVSEFCECVR